MLPDFWVCSVDRNELLLSGVFLLAHSEKGRLSLKVVNDDPCFSLAVSSRTFAVWATVSQVVAKMITVDCAIQIQLTPYQIISSTE
jgi:hypothetical protein